MLDQTSDLVRDTYLQWHFILQHIEHAVPFWQAITHSAQCVRVICCCFASFHATNIKYSMEMFYSCIFNCEANKNIDWTIYSKVQSSHRLNHKRIFLSNFQCLMHFTSSFEAHTQQINHMNFIIVLGDFYFVNHDCWLNEANEISVQTPRNNSIFGCACVHCFDWKLLIVNFPCGGRRFVFESISFDRYCFRVWCCLFFACFEYFLVGRDMRNKMPNSIISHRLNFEVSFEMNNTKEKVLVVIPS